MKGKHEAIEPATGAMAFGGKIANSIAQVRLNTKLSASSDDGLQSWYPYYAGYSEQFAEGIVRAAGSDGTLRILDPWNGSGTTTRAGHALGHQVVGFDINPVTLLVASAKLANPDDVKHIQGLASRFISRPDRVRPSVNDPLLRWLPTAIVGKYRAIEDQIISELATDENGRAVDSRSETLPPLAAFLLLALLRAAKSLAAVKNSSNPTWKRPSGDILPARSRQFSVLWIEALRSMASDLQSARGTDLGGGQQTTLALSTSRSLPVVDDSIDLIVTSPPYCTRIDYFVSSAFEIAALKIDENGQEYRALRQAAMGTNLSRSAAASHIPLTWPDSVKVLLSAIRQHPSKASGTYYLKTYAQYFGDCMQSLSEISRVLRPGGAAALVVQDSYYKDIHVDLPKLYVDCGASIGLVGKVTSSLRVSHALAQINSKSRKHQDHKRYVESVVVLEKPLLS